MRTFTVQRCLVTDTEDLWIDGEFVAHAAPRFDVYSIVQHMSRSDDGVRLEYYEYSQAPSDEDYLYDE